MVTVTEGVEGKVRTDGLFFLESIVGGLDDLV